MRLDVSKLFLSTLAVIAAIWTACAAFVLLWPVAMMRISGDMAHMEFQGLTWSITATGFFVGLFAWSILAASIVWLTASLYNRISEQ